MAQVDLDLSSSGLAQPYGKPTVSKIPFASPPADGVLAMFFAQPLAQLRGHRSPSPHPLASSLDLDLLLPSFWSPL